MYDRLCYQIEKYCGIGVQGRTYEEIFSLLEDNFPQEVRKFHDIFGNMLFSSSLHESEFPIDPYKISSSVLGVNLMKKLGIENYYDPYLDTLPMRNSNIKGNMNMSVFNPEVLGEKTTFVRKIMVDFFENNTVGVTRKDIRDILHSLKTRNFQTELTDIKSPRVRELLERVREHFVGMFDKNKILYIGFLQEIAQKTGITSLAKTIDV